MNGTKQKLVQTSSYQELAQLQQEAISALSRRLGRTLSILEAGCGQRWYLDLTGVDYTLTGVDLDEKALELRRTKTRDLDVAILGDLCSVELPEASFDVICSSFVLEHVPRADLALQNFVKWLRPGGLLILMLPDPGTVHGFFANATPHWFHILYYRHITKMKSAGLPGYGPYPTHYHPVIWREPLCSFLNEGGLNLLGCYGDGFSGYKSQTPSHLVRKFLRFGVKLASILSLGKLSADYSNVLYIAVKPLPG